MYEDCGCKQTGYMRTGEIWELGCMRTGVIQELGLYEDWGLMDWLILGLGLRKDGGMRTGVWGLGLNEERVYMKTGG
jgi:hypothetical protein